jgi:hypothetical protein
MPAATAEPEVKTAPKAETPPEPQYEMPRPPLGSEVLFYRDGTKDTKRQPEVSTVLEVGRSMVTLRVQGVAVDQVRHVSDPRLKNVNVRQLGAWEWSPTSQLIGRLLKDNEQSLKDIAALKKDVAELKAALK